MLFLAWIGCAAPVVPPGDTGRPQAPAEREGHATETQRRAVSTRWPADRTGAQIGGALAPAYEPSGITWHSGLGALLLVSDGGVVSRMNLDGSGLVNWTFAGDFEAITVVDPTSDLAYVGVERPDAIVEVDLAAGALTGRSWPVDAWMASADANQGLEALTFMPDGAHPYANGTSGGLFYAGLQETGDIYVFDVDLGASGVVSEVDRFATGRADLSDLHFHGETSVLYALFDTANLLREMTSAGATLAEYSVPGTEQEGVTLVPGCPRSTATVVIAEDAGASVKAHARYPIACP
ncbi:MAG: esterase-like activity of phytase family protein [Pseudomonadota bacterium]|nr:esterase-like activity of phytase family protein [Pseudomonadota bacterium]